LVDLTDGQSTREDALCICSRRVRAEENRFYIGITENPSRRFEEHLAVQGSWTRMVILCKAHSSNDTAYLERGLISQHRDNIRCLNIGRGVSVPVVAALTTCTCSSAIIPCCGDPVDLIQFLSHPLTRTALLIEKQQGLSVFWGLLDGNGVLGARSWCSGDCVSKAVFAKLGRAKK
jgi:hypothetical protein